MRYSALACDYDGTLALDGKVSKDTLEALQRLRSSGRRLILVTGRRLVELLSVSVMPKPSISSLQRMEPCCINRKVKKRRS
jgi:hypothetical protein